VPVDARLGLDALARTRVYVTASHDVRKLCPSSSSCISKQHHYTLCPNLCVQGADRNSRRKSRVWLKLAVVLGHQESSACRNLLIQA